jgi:hypothetical protein
VTTIPAAAHAAVALAYWVPSEAVGSAIQLVINLSAIVVAGTLTPLVLRARAEQLARRENSTHNPMGVWLRPVGDLQRSPRTPERRKAVTHLLAGVRVASWTVPELPLTGIF